MFKKPKLEWFDPLDFARKISLSSYKQNWIFLYSGLNQQIKKSKSYIGLYPQKEIVSEGFNELEKALQAEQNQYFGYLSYDLKNQLENLKNGEKSFIDLPNLWMINFGLVLEFDHNKKIVFCHKNNISKTEYSLDFVGLNIDSKNPTPLQKVARLTSNFSKKEYLEKVQTIQKKIINGEIYQANLTRKFFGKFSQKPQNPFNIFLKLNLESPANYSSFLKLNDAFIVSSSPELFLKIKSSGKVLSRPIKGTSKRFADKKLDQKSKQDLKNSLKEQAENLMIVDLVRNDLSKNCEPGTVEVKKLFEISSYKTIHHLSSEIWGQKNPQSSNLDIIKSCFPAGSMTGAPKIKAMEICNDLEEINRGIYSGAIGFVGGKNSELSVVIRTLIIRESEFEFQVGGAITFDSSPEKEWEETMNKAKGIAKTLGIKMVDLKRI